MLRIIYLHDGAAGILASADDVQLATARSGG